MFKYHNKKEIKVEHRTGSFPFTSSNDHKTRNYQQLDKNCTKCKNTLDILDCFYLSYFILEILLKIFRPYKFKISLTNRIFFNSNF